MPRGLSGRTIMVLCALVMGAGVVVSAQGPAYSNDHQPPATVLKKGDRVLQRGLLGTYCWVRPTGDGTFVFECVDTVPAYPAAERVREDSRLHICIHKTHRPRSFSLVAYRRVDRDGFPMGRAERIPFSLRRVVQGGQTVAWDVVFRVNNPDRHYYLDAFGVWKDEQGGGLDQDASWSFHVKTTGSGEIRGTRGSDALAGGDGEDIILGLGGGDAIAGGAGRDLLFGGGGDDVMAGGSGADEVVGGRGSDKLNGGSGPDDIAGGGGADIINAADGRGNDLIGCGPGSDMVNADKGDTVLKDCENTGSG